MGERLDSLLEYVFTERDGTPDLITVFGALTLAGLVALGIGDAVSNADVMVAPKERKEFVKQTFQAPDLLARQEALDAYDDCIKQAFKFKALKKAQIAGKTENREIVFEGCKAEGLKKLNEHHISSTD